MSLDEFYCVLWFLGIFGSDLELQIRPNVEHSVECSIIRPNVYVLAGFLFGFSFIRKMIKET